MSLPDRFAGAIVGHTKLAIAAMLVLTLVVGAGAPMVASTSSLDQFQTDTPAADKLEYIEANFSTGGANTTTAQIVVRGENVLSKEGLLRTLRYQQTLRDNATINATLVEERAISGVANVIATVAIREEQAAALQERATALQAENRSLQAEARALENRSRDLNATVGLLRGGLDELRANPDADVDAVFDGIQAQAPVTLEASHRETFRQAAADLRSATSGDAIEAAYQLGTQGVLADEFAALEERSTELEQRGQTLEDRAAQLEADREALATADLPTLAAQIEQLESMEAGAVTDLVERTLGPDTEADGRVFTLMPTDFEPGETSANATMLVVSQVSDNPTNVQGAATQETIDSQLAMRDLGQAAADGGSYLVFGSGIISHEIDASMQDSMTIVSPLALLFVLVALSIAYRDLLDIVLGVVGIGVVLVWTFGFMGWAGIDFNQIFVAVPVLLIGLSIDYAIHIFMRHREQRAEVGAGPRGSMTVALAGVGVALVWVTATTAIGFLSNLTSPVAPIQEFGVTSSVGIIAALLVFGVLIPALKVEIDETLEGWGLDRRKRAFGTGGNGLGKVLSVGAIGARKGPLVVLGLVLLVTAAGAYGGTQVETSFNQQDFLADDPPDWMKDLPEPFKPGEYSAKSSISFVNDRFVREDATAEFLIEGSVTDADTLERLAATEADAADRPVTLTLSSGEPAVDSVLDTIDRVRATNESFNATVAAADTDGDGVPDRDLAAVFDGLYATAPETAAQYVQREDGSYRALRMVVSVQGGADSGEIRDQMQAVAATLDGDGLTVTATGMAVLNAIVQDQLLDTVVESLLITLVSVFLFLMIAYRITDGSAMLGVVTLTPVALAVAWVLGSMYLLGIPFNVVTGMITSLTVGLGVAYSIHLSERYTLELGRQTTVKDAMDRAVTGTGGALLGSAATTVGGFGVLVFSILPPLRQFGLITGLSIVFAFVGAVFVLPTLLAFWTRFLGPEWARGQVTTSDWGGAGGGHGEAPTGSDSATATETGPGGPDAEETGAVED